VALHAGHARDRERGDRARFDAELGSAGRIIVATARVLGVLLVTSDARIIDSKLVPTIW
jgi:hypothetical protein